jgi:glycosyltransferase involved in cell wall biosynthesis
MARLLNSIDFDVLYLNSFFSFQFSIKPLLLRRLKLIPEVFTIVAPRGEFSPGALVLKWFKKRIFITFARSIGLYRYIHWQASSDLEAMDISNVFFNDNKIAVDSLISVASDVGSNHYVKSQLIKPLKRPGMLEIAFLSRISPKKNLDGALSMLIGLNGNITFNIFGPVEDQCYWQRCQSICDVLNTNIKVNFHGAVGHNSVKDAFCANHLFLFPTHGENFGHVILEAFLEGCPVLLSDQTPWRNLESLRVGWDLPLDSPDEFRSVLKRCVDMDNEEFTNISRSAMDYGKRFMNDSSNLECNKRLFTSLSNGNLPKQK